MNDMKSMLALFSAAPITCHCEPTPLETRDSGRNPWRVHISSLGLSNLV
jgi:hypothetical protein